MSIFLHCFKPESLWLTREYTYLQNIVDRQNNVDNVRLHLKKCLDNYIKNINYCEIQEDF